MIFCFCNFCHFYIPKNKKVIFVIVDDINDFLFFCNFCNFYIPRNKKVIFVIVDDICGKLTSFVRFGFGYTQLLDMVMCY